MKRTLTGMSAVLAMALLCAARTQAEELSSTHAEIVSLLEKQNARIAQLEAALRETSGEKSGGGTCSNGCCTGGCDSCLDSCCDSCLDGCCCDPCLRVGGPIASVEFLFLKPHASLGIGRVADFDFGYEPAFRLMAGYQGSDGLGVRMRYFAFDHQATAPVPAALAVVPGDFEVQAYDTYVFDLEMVDSMSLGCYWDASVFAGFRYVEFDFESFGIDRFGIAFEGQHFDNSSIGMTVGAELRRTVGVGLAGFVNTRASVLMGDENEFRIDPFGNLVLADVEIDNIYYIWEAQAGVQYSMEMEGLGEVFARAAFEVQMWDNMGGSGGVPGRATEDFGLGGVSFSAGVIR